MSTLKDKALQIQQEKNEKIIPENIKDGVQIFDVTGDYIGGDSIDLTTGIKFAESSFSTLPDNIINANWENITNMSYMFSNCASLTTVPLLNTSNVTNMSYTFSGCGNLTSIPQLDTSNVTDMSGMFRDCCALTTIPLLNTSNVEYMDSIFVGCTSLTTLPQLNTSNLKYAGFMFNYCSSLTTVSGLDFSNVVEIQSMFAECNNLQELDIRTLDFNNVVGVDEDFLINVPNNCHIKVSSSEFKDLLLEHYPDLTNIEVVNN